MKSMKFFTIIISLFITSLSFGQGAYDALRFSQQYYEGTARSLAMGNAFTALGGDLGAIPINPAASGVFRYSEFVVTPSLNTSVDHTTYLKNNSSENRTRFGLSNIGWLGHFSTGRTSGLLNMNVAFTANQTNNFNSRTSAYGRNASTSWAASMAANMSGNVTWNELHMPETGDVDKPFYNDDLYWSEVLGWNTALVDTLLGTNNEYVSATENIDKNGNIYLGGPLNQKYYKEVTGYTSDVSINVGGNISNKLFFGVNLTFQSINYRSFESFSESAVDPANFDLKFRNFTHSSSTSTNGVSVGLKAGLIYLPVAGLRIGAAISTPTWMYLTDNWEQEMSTSANGNDYSVLSPLGISEYRVTSPFKWNVGVAYTLGKIGLISFDYENTNYSKIRIADSNGNKTYFENENSEMSQHYKSVHNFRAGLEARLTPNISLRAGYNFYDAPYDVDDKNYYVNDPNVNDLGMKKLNLKKHFASIGVGYKTNGGFFADVAYQQQINQLKESGLLYNAYVAPDVPPTMNRKYLNWKLLVSIGFRF